MEGKRRSRFNASPIRALHARLGTAEAGRDESLSNPLSISWTDL